MVEGYGKRDLYTYPGFWRVFSKSQFRRTTRSAELWKRSCRWSQYVGRCGSAPRWHRDVACICVQPAIRRSFQTSLRRIQAVGWKIQKEYFGTGKERTYRFSTKRTLLAFVRIDGNAPDDGIPVNTGISWTGYPFGLRSADVQGSFECRYL